MRSLRNYRGRVRLTLGVMTVAIGIWGVPARGQQELLPQLAMDFRNAAVLCAWDLDVIASTTVLACGRERQQADDAIDQAIAAMDDYIVANSSGNETKETLEKKRQFIVQKNSEHADKGS
jgi:hypothetical protein